MKENKPVLPREDREHRLQTLRKPIEFLGEQDSCELIGRPRQTDYYFLKIREDPFFKKDRHP